ncbi:right-handed parallel beta-helix repeat-containing protein [Georgenia deserti]|uniref:Nitrous oxide reductase family maturation protein NosD n=1 Tax=Georgenia deserti TaxID=2093781 RepID=A0ABW4L309_9MICO
MTRAIALFGVISLLTALTACGTGTDVSTDEDPAILQVPEEHETISAAVRAAEPGDLVLVSPGVYREEVHVATEDVTVRGTERDEVVIDGEGVRPSGIVATADGVRIENLTVQETTFYGVLVTGLHDESGPAAPAVDDYERFDPAEFPPVERFGVSHVTAANNGLYGIYAFHAQHGYVTDSYASGSADSGLYVGQCRECDVLVQGNVAERNAVGFENANASDSVVVVGNRFSGNRVGMAILSNYQEAFTPQHGNTVVGNVVTHNDSEQSPAHAQGGFGIGIGVSGGQDNLFSRNLVTANPRAGILLTHAEDLAATGNTFEQNMFRAEDVAPNGVDIANTSAGRTPAADNCVTGASGLPTVLPDALLADCSGRQPATGAGELPSPEIPPGMSFLQVPAPPPQHSMDDAERVPDRLPATTAIPDLDSVEVPPPDFLAERSGRP